MDALQGAVLRTLRAAGIVGPPVDLDRVLRYLGLDDILWDYYKAHELGTSLVPDLKLGKMRIRVSPLLPSERLPFDLAHECVEWIAHREGLVPQHWKVNEAAAELLLPTAWVEEVLAREGFDLFVLHRTFPNASLDICAIKMVRLAKSPCILTVGSGKGHRRSFSRGISRCPISQVEEATLAEAFSVLEPIERKAGNLTLKAFPVPGKKSLNIARVFLFCLFPERVIEKWVKNDSNPPKKVA